MAYLLGIDQGGSKTLAVIGDDHGNILGLGQSRGAVHSSDGLDVAMQACKDAADIAMSQAGIANQDIEVVCGGLSGIDWDDEEILVQEALCRTLGINRVHVVNDCIIALRGGTIARNSAIICAGSGLNCAVRAGNRQIQFGYYIPDNIQGGMSIGHAALQCVFDAEAGVGLPTSLTHECMNYIGVSSVNDLLRANVEGRITGAQILYLPQMVEQEAIRGDAIANDILGRFALSLAPYVVSGMRKLDIENEEIEIVLSGSIFKCKAPILLETLQQDLLRKIPGARIINAVYEPVIGAYFMALDDYCGESSSRSFRAIDKDNKYHILRRVQ